MSKNNTIGKGYAELAKMIAGADQPVEDWLLRGIEKAAAGIGFAVRKANEHPSRENMRRDLRLDVEAARRLRKRLDERTLQRILAEAPANDLFLDVQLFHSLNWLIICLQEALKDIPTGSSRHKFDPGTASPESACALIVAVAWRRVRGQFPPHTGAIPQEACSSLWTLAGAPAAGFGGTQVLSGWRVHLQRAKLELESGPRPEIERLFEPPTW